MERIGSTQTSKVIQFIRDCFDEMAMQGAREIKVSKQNIVTSRTRYLIPLEAVELSSVSVLCQENATELMESEDRVLTAGTSNWTNGDYDTFDKTTDLSLTASASDEYCYLDSDDIITVGKRYRLHYDLTLVGAAAGFKLQTEDSEDDLATFAAGTQNVVEFTATETSELRITATGIGTGHFDNFSLKEMALDKYREASRLIGEVSPDYFDEET